MAVTDDSASGVRGSVADAFPSKHLPRPEVRDLPPAPVAYRKLIGPGIIAAGVGLASGEFILYPFIASQVGLVFVWATSSATLISYMTGGTPRFIAIGLLVVIGLILTLAPVVYVALERAQMVKV